MPKETVPFLNTIFFLSCSEQIFLEKVDKWNLAHYGLMFYIANTCSFERKGDIFIQTMALFKIEKSIHLWKKISHLDIIYQKSKTIAYFSSKKGVKLWFKIESIIILWTNARFLIWPEIIRRWSKWLDELFLWQMIHQHLVSIQNPSAEKQRLKTDDS